MIGKYLLKKGTKYSSKDGLPGKHWRAGFRKRWPELYYQKPEHLGKNRDAFFVKIAQVLEESSLQPDLPCHLWNCDDVAIAVAVTAKRVFARRGARLVYNVQGSSDRKMHTVLSCESAAGVYIIEKNYLIYCRLTVASCFRYTAPSFASLSRRQISYLVDGEFACSSFYVNKRLDEKAIFQGIILQHVPSARC